MKSIWLCLVVILLAACERAEQPAADTSVTEFTQTVATTETAPVDTAATQPSGTNTIEVTLTEYRIAMPSSIRAGRTRFEITNSGKLEHSFEIEGQGIEQELSSPVKPGETGSLEVDLPAGSYRVYCPVRDHDTRHGMSLQLTVS